MTAYRVEDLLQGIFRGFDADPVNRWLDVEILPMDAAGDENSLRACMELYPRFSAAIDVNALTTSPHAMRPLALAFTHLARSPLVSDSTSAKAALVSIVCKVVDVYEHSIHDCIQELGELMEIVRTRYLPIKLGYQFEVMTTFYNNNLGHLPDDQRLLFLKAGDQYIRKLAKTCRDETAVCRPLLTILDRPSFMGWTRKLFTHPSLTAMFSCTFGTMFSYNNPVWVRPEGDVESRLLSFVDLIEQILPQNLKLTCFNVDLLLVGQLLDGMRIAAARDTEHTPRLVGAAQALVGMALPELKNLNKLSTNLFKPSLGAKEWLLPPEVNGLVRALCEVMENWSEPTDIAPALSTFRKHFFCSAFQAAGVNTAIELNQHFNDLARAHGPELLDQDLQDGIGQKGRSVLADFAIHTSNEDLKEMLARTPDLQVRSKIFQDDLGL